MIGVTQKSFEPSVSLYKFCCYIRNYDPVSHPTKLVTGSAIRPYGKIKKLGAIILETLVEQKHKICKACIL